MILLLDNFDSFTYNLADYLGQLSVDYQIFRNNISLHQITRYQYEGIVLSPGPQTPQKAGHLMKVIEYYHQSLPILGICLGHQALGTFFGAKLVRAHKPMHGKISRIRCKDHFLFDTIPENTTVVRYHSLILEQLPACLSVIAETTTGEVMGIQHKYLNINGLQFHPEAILTEYGLKMIENWARFNQLLPGEKEQ